MEKSRGSNFKFEAWSDGILIGLVALYCNDQSRHLAYITSVSVLEGWARKGIASSLIDRSIAYVKELGGWELNLEVSNNNTSAIKLYEKSGFVVRGRSESMTRMVLNLRVEERHD